MGIGGATMSTQGQQQNALIEDVQIKPIDRMLDGGGDDDSEEERRKFRKGITMAQAGALKKRKSIFYALENVNLGNISFVRSKENAIDPRLYPINQKDNSRESKDQRQINVNEIQILPDPESDDQQQRRPENHDFSEIKDDNLQTPKNNNDDKSFEEHQLTESNEISPSPTMSKLPRKRRSGGNTLRRDRFALQAINGFMQGGNQNPFNDSITRAASKMGGLSSTIYQLQKQETLDSNKLQQHTQRLLKQQDRLYDQWRALDLMASTIATVGLIIAIYSHELDLAREYEMIQANGGIQYDDNKYVSEDNHIYRLIVTGLTITTIVIMTLRHHFLTKWRLQLYKFTVIECMLKPVDFNRQKQMKSLARSSFLKSKQYYVDILFLVFQPLPYWDPTFTMRCINIADKTKFLDIEYNISTVLISIMFLRFIFIVRTCFNYSIFTDQHAKKLMSDTYGFSPDLRFTLKCILQRSPELTVTIILSVSILVVAYILRIFEIVYYRHIGFQDFEQFMATVGFGDVVPVSHVGRFLIMLTAIWGTFIFTLVIVAFSVVFNLSPHQKRAMHHLLLTRKAATTLTTALKYFNARKRAQQNVNPIYKEMLQRKISITYVDADLKRQKMKMDEHINDFREERIQLKRLRVNDGNEQRKNIHFIKGEVLEIQNKIETMGHTMVNQKIESDSLHMLLEVVSKDQRALRVQMSEQHNLIKEISRRLKPIAGKGSKIDNAPLAATVGDDLKFQANYENSSDKSQDQESEPSEQSSQNNVRSQANSKSSGLSNSQSRQSTPRSSNMSSNRPRRYNDGDSSVLLNPNKRSAMNNSSIRSLKGQENLDSKIIKEYLDGESELNIRAQMLVEPSFTLHQIVNQDKPSQGDQVGVSSDLNSKKSKQSQQSQVRSMPPMQPFSVYPMKRNLSVLPSLEGEEESKSSASIEHDKTQNKRKNTRGTRKEETKSKFNHRSDVSNDIKANKNNIKLDALNGYDIASSISNSRKGSARQKAQDLEQESSQRGLLKTKDKSHHGRVRTSHNNESDIHLNANSNSNSRARKHSEQTSGMESADEGQLPGKNKLKAPKSQVLVKGRRVSVTKAAPDPTAMSYYTSGVLMDMNQSGVTQGHNLPPNFPIYYNQSAFGGTLHSNHGQLQKRFMGKTQQQQQHQMQFSYVPNNFKGTNISNILAKQNGNGLSGTVSPFNYPAKRMSGTISPFMNGFTAFNGHQNQGKQMGYVAPMGLFGQTGFNSSYGNNGRGAHDDLDKYESYITKYDR
ncbi:hypothetical protein FGO68_gene5323 [Halteria grandinella]|uniref:Potassium channel domain-containing protein n=1 Tax=Halteria grandinella TaxID=5974 RepID=A0A8J8P712_HALGN|nr:hypothetical protein FGO68_gene5323 [Halteria grandinella]